MSPNRCRAGLRCAPSSSIGRSLKLLPQRQFGYEQDHDSQINAMTDIQSALLEDDEQPSTERRPRVRRSDAPTPPGRPEPFAPNTVTQMDCIEGMRKLADNSVDVAIADPPYNLSKGGRWKWDNSVALPGMGGDWSKVMADWDDMPLGEYLSFSLAWLAELKRVVRPSGSIWIHGTYHNIGIINFALQLLAIEMINEVVWYKRNSFPNLSGRRLTASHETILWAHTGGQKERRYFFAYDKAKAMHTVGDLMKEPGKQMRTVWDIPNNKGREELAHGKHPTQKPVRLIRRMLEVSARPGALLLVPFTGSGADCVAARQLGVDFLAFETEQEFVDLATRRVSAVGDNSFKFDET